MLARTTSAIVGLGLLLIASGCSAQTESAHDENFVTVPAMAATIGAAMDLIADGGLILVSPGTYTEAVLIDKPGVTLRGTDRNAVVIDGEGLRPEGVVVIADGVRVENLTVRNHTFNGVLVTGLHDGADAQAHGLDGYDHLDPEQYPAIQGFSIDHVTASNNGLYGLYAFDSQHGSITNSYASGSADSGIYVGQCRDCDILVQGNTAENNAIGFENANASDSVYIVGNRFANNRVGMTLLSNYQEAFVPQTGNTVVGNLVSDNVSSTSPAQADGAFGIGIGISGGQDNLIARNTIAGNATVGVQLGSAEDISAIANRLEGNEFASNGVDVANTSTARSPASATCLTGAAITLPVGFADCGAAAQAAVTRDALASVDVPPGMSFLRVPLPPDQPSLTGDLALVPGPLPSEVALPDLASFLTPDRDWVPLR